MEPLVGHSLKPQKAKPKGPNSKEHPTLFLAQNNPSYLTAKVLSMIGFIMKKTDGLATIVWVSIPVRPKLHSRVRHLLQKVINLNYDGLWTLA